MAGPHAGVAMCRFLGYVGPRVEVDALIFAPPFGLERQAWAPRRQQFGNVNADGWGIAWYDLEVRPEPARYRTTVPMWADRNFREMAPLLSSSCVIAAVRDATPGMPVEESGTAPFLSGRYVFAHNGLIDGFRSGVGTMLRRALSTERDSQILGSSDSEVAFAMLLDRIDKGAPLDLAVRETIAEIRSISAGRLNFLVSDGDQVVASRAGDSLFVSSSATPHGRATLVASEPLDDGAHWTDVPGESLVIARRDADPDLQPLS
ncbi:MAG: ergothioneine biosynthesis protein EgtC [Actinobacteria bacterium]|nr:ergothioneine biosynthesis protein EgtC [Actinomycetota bacterium]